jgi:hypothetical protein
MKTTTKRLSLSRETLRRLDRGALHNVQGGGFLSIGKNCGPKSDLCSQWSCLAASCGCPSFGCPTATL